MCVTSLVSELWSIHVRYAQSPLLHLTLTLTSKGPFIATQLKTRPTSSWVELRRRVAIDTSPTQLNSTRVESSCVAIDRRNSTQLTQLKSVQPISAKQVSRVFVYFFLSRVTVSVLSIVELRELCYLILISSLQNSIVKLVKTRHIKKIMMSWLTNWVNWVTTFRTDRWHCCSRRQRVELSWVASL